MKVALCISGHMRSFARVYPNLLDNLIQPNDCDVFVYTSDVNSHKGRPEPEQSPFIIQSGLLLAEGGIIK